MPSAVAVSRGRVRGRGRGRALSAVSEAVSEAVSGGRQPWPCPLSGSALSAVAVVGGRQPWPSRLRWGWGLGARPSPRCRPLRFCPAAAPPLPGCCRCAPSRLVPCRVPLAARPAVLAFAPIFPRPHRPRAGGQVCPPSSVPSVPDRKIGAKAVRVRAVRPACPVPSPAVRCSRQQPGRSRAAAGQTAEDGSRVRPRPQPPAPAQTARPRLTATDHGHG